MHLLANSDPETGHELGQFLTAVSSNKSNEVALRMGLHIWSNWAEAGKPTEPGAITKIAQQAMQTFGTAADDKGIMPVDTNMLERFVTGQGSFYHPENTRYAKIAQMGQTMAGDPWAGVLDRHTGRTLRFGKELQPISKSYFAMKDWLKKAAQSENMTLEEGQAANWAVGRLLSPDISLTAPEILAKVKSGNIMKEGESYADLIIKDPEVNRLARKVIAKSGGNAETILADIAKITEKPRPGIEASKKEASNKTFQSYIGKSVKERDLSKATEGLGSKPKKK